MRYLTRSTEIRQTYGTKALIRRILSFVFIHTIGGVIARTYNRFIWPLLPKTGDLGTCNKISVPEPVAKEKRALDSLVPWQTPSKKSAYERELIKAIRRGVNVGDTVTMIGGGNGVSSVSAAERVDQSGTIYIYEGSKKRIGIIKDVFDINDVSIRFEVFHGVVGPAICVEDDGHEAPRINPESLDECDVLGLDCEGSEVEILENIKISPRMIIVETHAQFDAPAELVREILYEKGYSITHEAIDDPTRGIKILIGTRE